MLLYDMIGTNKNICFFKAYSLDDYSYKGEYITYGRGPDELLAPALSGTIRSGKDGTDYGYIYDGMLGKSFCFDINRSIKENETILQELTKLPANTIYAFPYLDSLQFIMNIENDRVLYHILDTQSNAIDTFDMFRDDISAEKEIQSESSRIQSQNEHKGRKKGTGSQKGKGKKTAHLLKKATIVWLFFVGGGRPLRAAAIGQDRVPAYTCKQRGSFAFLYEVFWSEGQGRYDEVRGDQHE